MFIEYYEGPPADAIVLEKLGTDFVTDVGTKIVLAVPISVPKINRGKSTSSLFVMEIGTKLHMLLQCLGPILIIIPMKNEVAGFPASTFVKF